MKQILFIAMNIFLVQSAYGSSKNCISTQMEQVDQLSESCIQEVNMALETSMAVTDIRSTVEKSMNFIVKKSSFFVIIDHHENI